VEGYELGDWDLHEAGACGGSWKPCTFCEADIDDRIKASLSNLCKICNNVAEQSGYCFRHELKIEELHNARLYDLRVIGE